MDMEMFISSALQFRGKARKTFATEIKQKL